MTRHTPLHDIHRAAGAKMVDFAGWDMPHPLRFADRGAPPRPPRRRHVRRFAHAGGRCGRLRRPTLAAPPGRQRCRQAGRCRARRSTPACSIADGGVIDDLIVYFFSPTATGSSSMPVRPTRIWPGCSRTAAGFDVSITPRRDLAMIAVQGPNAASEFWRAIPGSREASENADRLRGCRIGEMLLARTGYTGEDGFEITLPATAGARQPGRSCSPPASRRSASARATPCASKPA